MKLAIKRKDDKYFIYANGREVSGYETLIKASRVLKQIKDGSVYIIDRRYNLGVGDAIALSGACVVLSNRYDKIAVPYMPRNEVNVKSFFVDYPNIEMVEWDALLNDEYPGINIFQGNEKVFYTDKLDIYQRIYRDLSIDYKERWNSCPLVKASTKVNQIELPDKEYIFLHDDLTRGLKINENVVNKNLHVFRPEFNPDVSILSLISIIENAAEIHVIDSAFLHLTEQLNPSGKLFFHRYARKFEKELNSYKLKHKWNLID